MFGRCSFVMLYVFLALALLSGCALTYAASGFASLAAVWQVPVFFLGCFLALVVLFLLVVLVSCLFVDPKSCWKSRAAISGSSSTSSAALRWHWAVSMSM